MDFVRTASTEQRKALLSVLEEYTDPYHTADGNSYPDTDHEHEPTDNPNADISSFVVHVENLAIDEDLSNGNLEEISSLKLRTKGKKGRVAKIKTQWLTPKLDGLNLENTICKPKTQVIIPLFLNSWIYS